LYYYHLRLLQNHRAVLSRRRNADDVGCCCCCWLLFLGGCFSCSLVLVSRAGGFCLLFLFIVVLMRKGRAKFKQHNKSEEAAGVFLLAFSCLNRRIQIRQFRAWKVTNFRLERVRLKNKSGTQFSCIRSFHSRKLKNVFSFRSPLIPLFSLFLFHIILHLSMHSSFLFHIIFTYCTIRSYQYLPTVSHYKAK
jgi:hypothetical protein